MKPLKVETQVIKKQYRAKDWLWRYIIRGIMRWYANQLWSYSKTVWCSITIDINRGSMKYYYFRYGFWMTLKRVNNYTGELLAELNGTKIKRPELERENFYETIVIFDDEGIDNQLNDEIKQIY